MSVTLFACMACAHTCFPARQICHRCGSAAWRPVIAETGLVEEATTVLYQTGSQDAGPCHLASVRVAGVVLLARLDVPGAAGQSVSLRTAESGAILGTAD